MQPYTRHKEERYLKKKFGGLWFRHSIVLQLYLKVDVVMIRYWTEAHLKKHNTSAFIAC